MKKNLVICAAAALTVGAAAAETAPLLKVPCITPEESDLILRGDWEDDELWRNAATIDGFSCAGAAAPAATRAQLFHDGTGIILRAVIKEEEPIFASGRNWQESFVGDSAFRFALGAGSLGVSQSAIAGYESPYSSRQDLRHFYEYTINAAGSLSRRYNECPVRNPLFGGCVDLTEDGWEALMFIPLASAGISWEPGSIYYCNLSRFHLGDRWDWVPAGGSGYTPLKFGLLELLEPERNGERSIFGPLPAAGEKKSGPPRVSKPALTYYPLGGKVTAQVPEGGDGETAELSANGNRAVFAIGPGARGVCSVPVELPAGGKFTAVLTRNGREELKEEFTVPEKPEWYDTDAGIEYLEEKVAFPWQPIEFRDGEAHLAHAEWEFGDSTLPRRITVKGRELLAAPVYVTGVLSDGWEAPVSDLAAERRTTPPFVESLPMDAEGALRIKSRLEFDGFAIFRIRAEGLGETSWRELAVHIPIRSEVCEFLNFGYSQDLLRIGNGGYAGNPSQFWVGNGSIGLSFSYDRNCFPNGTAAPRVEIAPGEIILRLADTGSGTFPEDFVWQFFLHPTPVRGDFIPPFSDKMSTGAFERWSAYQGFPDLGKIPAVRQAAEIIHGNKAKLYVYFSNLLAENSPGYQEYRADLEALPQRMWYQRAYDPGRGVRCFVTCLRKERGDQILHGVARLLDECGIDGVYLDGPTEPFSCANPGHDCDDSLPAVWDDDCTGGRILGQRAFVKRLRGIFDAKGIKYPLWSHTGGSIYTSTLSLADYYYDGEQLARFRDGYLVEPEKFRINYALHGLGVRGRFLPILYYNSTFTCRQALPWSLVHAAETSALKSPHPLDAFFFSFLRREAPAKFYPYWEEQPHWRVEADETILASYLRDDDEGVLVLSNLYQDGVKTVTVDLEPFFDGREMRIACLTGDEKTFARDGNKITFSLRPASMKMFYVTANDTLPENLPSPLRPKGASGPADPLPAAPGFRADDWEMTGVETQEDGSVIFPAGGAAAARMVCRRRLPEPFTMRMTLEHSGPLKIFIDEVEIAYTPAIGWLIDGVDEFENEDYCATSHKGHRGGHEALNRPVDLTISMADGHLNVSYDGARLLHHALPAVDNAVHAVAIEVPAGGEAKLQLDEVTGEGTIPFPEFELIHPVLAL